MHRFPTAEFPSTKGITLAKSPTKTIEQQSSRATRHRPLQNPKRVLKASPPVADINLGSGSNAGSSPEKPTGSKFFPKGYLAPVYLRLQFDAPVEGGLDFGRNQLNRPVLLIHAQDPAFASCWFSRAIDFGDESGNPGYWMLEKTAMDAWTLLLRRVSGETAVYQMKSKTKLFPIKLNRIKTTSDYKWPTTITICQGE